MKSFYILIIAVFCFNCTNDKALELAEIHHSNITEILDVSPAYLFYNTANTDSLEVNKRNLISTTNWLVNVDKRLSLKQAIPAIKALQDKKENASHKNKNAKNYFTAFNPNSKNLCFLEFTATTFRLNTKATEHIKTLHDTTAIVDISSEAIRYQNQVYKLNTFINALNTTNNSVKLVLNFDQHITFQDYLQFKDALLTITKTAVLIDRNEFIY